ncbi:erythromycin esterase family protein [Kribbella sp. NPDC056345]|uniref:erythromycin esterase family protein n=1 Tax=Kribbella sp. NPDC056345 TaxID=3345789 RepID=UPI0035DAA44A
MKLMILPVLTALVGGLLTDPAAADLAKVAHPIVSVEPGGDLSDLAILGRQVGSAQVVGIGEATHSSHEFFTFKHRAFQALVEQKGFTTFALEAAWSTGLALDRYVVTGAGDPREIMRREFQDSYRFWNTQEYLDLIEWMRSYNQTHARKVRFMGDDLGYVGPEVPDRVVEFVRKARPRLAATVSRLYGGIRSTAEAKEWTEQYLAKSLTARRQLEVDARKALQLVSSVPGGREQRWAVQHARTVWQVAKIYSFDLDDPELAPKSMLFRDQVMADNVAWWVRETGSKTVLSAHNGHIATQAYEPDNYPKVQGQFLREQFGRGYVALGTTFTEGSFNAHDPRDPARPLRVVTLGPPPTGSNEETLAAVPGNYLVDLRTLPPAAARWIRPDRLTREYGTDYPVEPVSLSLKKSFDILVHLRQITAANLL